MVADQYFDLQAGSCLAAGDPKVSLLHRGVRIIDRVAEQFAADGATRFTKAVDAMQRGDPRVGRAGVHALKPGARADSYPGPGFNGLYRPEQLAFIDPNVVEEQHLPNAFASLFTVNPVAHPGAERVVTQFRRHTAGIKPVIGCRVTDIPVADTAMAEFSQPRIWLINGYQSCWFDQQTSADTGMNPREGEREACFMAHNDFWNTAAFQGHPDLGLTGLVDYPIETVVLPVPLGETSGTTTAVAQQQLRAVLGLLKNRSGTAFEPTRVVTSVRVQQWLSNPREETDATIEETALKVVPTVARIEAIREFEDFFGEDLDCMLIYNDSPSNVDFIGQMPPMEIPRAKEDLMSFLNVVVSALSGLRWKQGSAIKVKIRYQG